MGERGLGLIGVFGVASLIAILAGCWTAAQHGIPVTMWGRGIVAWVVGLAIALALRRSPPLTSDRAAALVAATGVVLLLACFVEPGLDGVHRWIVAGPVRINVAAAILPFLIVVLSGRRWAPVALLMVMLLLVAQPDASQASAVAIAGLCLVVAARQRGVILVAAGVLAVLAVVAWFRPDPLPSVAEVEGIIALAWDRAPIVAVSAVGALALAVATPLLDSVRSRDAAAAALAGYMAVTAFAPAIGAFPVPLVGLTISPVIGFWLGIGALAQRRRSS